MMFGAKIVCPSACSRTVLYVVPYMSSDLADQSVVAASVSIGTVLSLSASDNKTATMSTGEEIAAKIGELGEQIKAAKAEKKAKEIWEGALNEMLALKVRNYYVTSFCVGQETVILNRILNLTLRFYSFRQSTRS